jgi:uncharacterized ferredoxin-like protein
MKQFVFVAMMLMYSVGLQAQRLEKIWATDSTLKVPESVLLDEKNKKIFF